MTNYLGVKDAVFFGLEAINTSSRKAVYTCKEVQAVCPVTGQPDFYKVKIYIFGNYGIETKSLKLYFQSLRDEGVFAEDLAAKIQHDVADVITAIGGGGYVVTVYVKQNIRGGITIEAEA